MNLLYLRCLECNSAPGSRLQYTKSYYAAFVFDPDGYNIEAVFDFNIQDLMNISFAEMSLGTQRKFLLAAFTIGNPYIYIFDEPTNAIEEKSRKFFINYLLSIKDSKIIICSIHDKDLISCLNAQELKLRKYPTNQLIS